jgi:hypothetical protein
MTAREIILYLESDLDEALKKYNHWKDIDTSEAVKYRIKANMLEDVLDNIDPGGELAESEEIAKVLVSDPEEKKPKRTFLRIYLNVFFLIVFFTSLIAIDLFLTGLLEKLGITGSVSSTISYVLSIVHIISFALLFINQDLIMTTKKTYKGER